jgi:hypothetical protein
MMFHTFRMVQGSRGQRSEIRNPRRSVICIFALCAGGW